MKKGVIIGIIVVIAIGASLAMSYNSESVNQEVILTEEATLSEDATVNTDEPSQSEGKSYTVDLNESLSIKTP